VQAVDGPQLGGDGEEGRGCRGEQDEGESEEAIVQAEPRCAQPGRPQVSFFPAVWMGCSSEEVERREGDAEESKPRGSQRKLQSEPS
jgi:hypothetical protein